MKTASCKRFTLIELLVVIAIIGILAGLVFPALGTVRNNAKKSKASSECQSLKTAIIMYESEFSCWPADMSGKSADFIVKDSDYVMMCKILTGLNSKKMIFYEVGVGYNENKGILDPWGRPYQVIIDADYDGMIKSSEVSTLISNVGKYYGNDSTKKDIRAKVAVFAYGVNENEKNSSDLNSLAERKKLVISW